MAEFQVEHRYEASADALWERLGDFAGHGDWMPGIVKNEVEGEGLGATRRLYFNETMCVVETLTAHDDAARSLSYSLDEGPAPVENYVGTITVIPEGEGARVEWSARFDAPAGVDPEALKPAMSGAYAATLAALAKLVE